jgi:hypothetical protein
VGFCPIRNIQKLCDTANKDVEKESRELYGIVEEDVKK